LAQLRRRGEVIDSPSFPRKFLDISIEVLQALSDRDIDRTIVELCHVRERQGRVFFCGSGGGAGHSSHAACDFRKLTHIESYCVTDNVSELTARINDESWEDSYASWLRESRLSKRDALFVFSVGGGDLQHGVSMNLVRAMEHATGVGASVLGVAGRDGGTLRQVANACVLIPVVDPALVTPQTEGIQALIWHLIVSDPRLASTRSKWESIASGDR
jgi:D-sedoheptulose 7-phosphate isomerase